MKNLPITLSKKSEPSNQGKTTWVMVAICSGVIIASVVGALIRLKHDDWEKILTAGIYIDIAISAIWLSIETRKYRKQNSTEVDLFKRQLNIIEKQFENEQRPFFSLHIRFADKAVFDTLRSVPLPPAYPPQSEPEYYNYIINVENLRNNIAFDVWSFSYDSTRGSFREPDFQNPGTSTRGNPIEFVFAYRSASFSLDRLLNRIEEIYSFVFDRTVLTGFFAIGKDPYIILGYQDTNGLIHFERTILSIRNSRPEISRTEKMRFDRGVTE